MQTLAVAAPDQDFLRSEEESHCCLSSEASAASLGERGKATSSLQDSVNGDIRS